MYFSISAAVRSVANSISSMSDFKFRVYRLKRWWGSSSSMRRCILTIIAILCLLVLIVFSLFSVCFGGDRTGNDYLMNVKRKRSTGDGNELLRSGTFQVSYLQSGRVMTERGKSFINITAPVSTALIYSFSPEVEQFFTEAVYDPFDENRYVGLGPAIIENDDGSFLTIQRIWFSHYDVLYSRDPEIKTKNTFQENFLYKRTFDANWVPMERGNIMGIPSATNCHYAYRSDGPMDPRLFKWNQTTFMSFHLWQFDRDQNEIRGRMFMWNYEKNRLIKLNVPEDFKHRLQRTEINWIPITLNNTLYYIYSFDPLRVFKCDGGGDCTYAQWPKGEAKVKFNPGQDVLRGGSPFILYKWPYYISIGHSQTATVNEKLLYGANIIVLSVYPHFRVVYVGSPLKIKEQLLSSARLTRQYTILRPFIFPVGISLRSPDVLDFSAHLSDTRGYIFRLRGVEQLMKNIIETDQLAREQNPKSYTNEEPLRFRLVHMLVAQDLGLHHRLSRLQYPQIVDNDI